MAEPQIAVNGTVVLEVLDCTVCFHPLKPPIFQCAVGHVICSSCYGKLVDKDRCQACAAGGGYNRCFAIEHIVDAVRVPCSYSVRYGCAAVTRYHEREEHEGSCPHAPCYCPEDRCGFAGSAAALLHHLAADHGWPSVQFELGASLTLQVQEGTRVLHNDDDDGGSLFLLRFTLAPPFGVAATVLCVDPHAALPAPAERKFKCHLSFICPAMGLQQFSDFQIGSSNLSGGLLSEGGYSFVVPNVPCGGAITVSIVKIMRDKCGNEIQLNKRWRQSSLSPLFS